MSKLPVDRHFDCMNKCHMECHKVCKRLAYPKLIDALRESEKCLRQSHYIGKQRDANQAILREVEDDKL